MKRNRTIRRIREGLSGLEELHGLFEGVRALGGARARADERGVLELEEVAPGVFAAPRPKLQAVEFITRARSLLDEAERLQERAAEIGKEARAWRKSK